MSQRQPRPPPPPTPGIQQRLGEVDSQNCNRGMWLVKIPVFVLDKLKQVNDQSFRMGRLRIYDGQSTTHTLTLENNEIFADISKEYALSKPKEDDARRYMLSMDPDGVPNAIEGRIELEMNAQPVINDEYREIMRRRTLSANKRDRKIVEDNDVATMRRVGDMAALQDVDNWQRKRPAFDFENRRERMDKQDLRAKLFTMFKDYPYWSLKGIVEFTNQPEAFIREEIASICEYNKRGPYKSLYQLKSEYRNGGGGGGGSGGSGAAGPSSSGDAKAEKSESESDDDSDDDDDDNDDEDMVEAK